MSAQNGISPCNINTISSRQLKRVKKNINWGIGSWWSNTKFSKTHIRIVWQYGSIKNIVAHFTVACLVAKPLNKSEAKGDLVIIKSCCFSNVNFYLLSC